MDNPFRKVTTTAYPNLYRRGEPVGVVDNSVQEVTINTNQILYIHKYTDLSNISQIVMTNQNCYFYTLHTLEELMEIIHGP